jgi:hypothetical protein
VKRSQIAVLVAAALVATVGSVAAQNGGKPVAQDVTFTLMASDAVGCPGFDVTGSVSGNAKTIALPGGGQIVNGPNLRITLSANGNSVSYVITGASHIAAALPNGDVTWTMTGRNLILLPTVEGRHTKGMFLTTGAQTFILDASGGEVQPFSGPGTVVDVCATLAA